MINKSVYSGLLVSGIFAFGLLFITFHPIHKSIFDWSDPLLFYSHPYQYKTLRFDVDVNDGKINVAAAYSHLNENNMLAYSSIYQIRQEPEGDIVVMRLSQEEVPSESPAIFRDLSGKLQFIWGDRLQDPDFQQWPDDFPHTRTNFSTDVAGYQPGVDFDGPEYLYAANHGYISRGNIGFPINISEDATNRLHIVFRGDSISEGGGQIPYPAYLSRNSEGHWSSPRFIGEGGSMPNIVAYDQSRLIVTYLGSAPNQPSINDIMAVYSDDRGVSWSSQELVFLSGQNPCWLLRMIKAPGGRIHLLWGQGIHAPDFAAPDAIWHCFSDNGGQTWTEPELVFNLRRPSIRPPGAPAPDPTLLHIFYNYEIKSDSYGNLHWVGCAIKMFESGQSENSLFYSSWSPTTGQWDTFSEIELGTVPEWFSLAYDSETNDLYVFWADVFETDKQGLYYSKKSLAVNVKDPPKFIPEGPINLHSNYPNPFSSATMVPFTLEKGGEVVLLVYDITGRKISSEILGVKPPGYHEHSIDFRGQNSGTYFYEITLDGKYRQQKNMVFLK